MKKLIIVESPSKAKTIESYLGHDVKVLSSKGHIRDLAISGVGGLGIDIENNYEPSYKIIKGKESTVKELMKAAKDKEVFIATDPDREGEAIGWHLAQILSLDLNKPNRIIFREITKNAVRKAIEEPLVINQSLVNSQEARRILDRIIGFKLSTLLQKKINSKSAGRVQSVALKLIVDVEKEIRAFIPETYYEIKAHFKNFVADYIIPAKDRLSKTDALNIIQSSGNEFKVSEIKQNESKRYAKPAFTTSSLQIDANQHLNMGSTKTMSVAQKLYEGIEIDGELTGLITYMRTDSTRLSNDFIHDAKRYIHHQYGQAYVGYYKETVSKDAQDAHEGIRPTNLKYTPDYVRDFLQKDEFKLYERIFNRAVASLMAPAIFNKTKITLDANQNLYSLEGSILLFDGFTHIYDDIKSKDKLLPELKANEIYHAILVEPIEKQTQPKARFSEATLIKAMESNGIGRPSTYAQTIATLKARDYVELKEKRLHPTDQGMLTVEKLDEFFSDIINVDYTKDMESDLDLIAENKKSGVKVVDQFYHKFIPLVDHANTHMEKKEAQTTDELCPECGKPLVIRTSKYGSFIACSGFPKCRYIKKEDVEVQNKL